jgi:purine catabolism regulator
MHPGAAIDEREATEMAAELGFDRRALLRLPMVAIGTWKWLEAEASDEAPWPILWREVTRELESMRMSAIAGVLTGEGLAIVVALRAESDRAEVAGRISRTLRPASESRLSGQELIICAGSVARSWTEVGAELHDALEMSHAVVRAPRQEWLDTTAVRLEPLLWALRNDEALRSFVRRRLDPLAAHDREHRTQFLATVEAYCVHSGRIAETARELHLQRQSLYKRIERVQELLGCDLAEPDTRLGLHFALRARSYLAALESTGEQ